MGFNTRVPIIPGKRIADSIWARLRIYPFKYRLKNNRLPRGLSESG